MSTKNLAHTVIEGGRYRHNKFLRRYSNAAERARAHAHERQLLLAPECVEEQFEPRTPVRRAFRDKLSPARRWLKSQVKRPWDKVRSELFARFDARTTAGRHVLFDHLLREVCDGRDPLHTSYADFFVSLHGLLLCRGPERIRSRNRRKPLPEPEPVLHAWLAGRRVAVHGARLYWLVLTPHGAFRQQRELDASERARFVKLPRWFRKQLEGPVPHAERR